MDTLLPVLLDAFGDAGNGSVRRASGVAPPIRIVRRASLATISA